MQRRRTSPIRTARTKAKLSQAQLGAALGVSKSAVSGWEAGRDVPHPSRLARLGRALPDLDMPRYLNHLERHAPPSAPVRRAG
jgi:transcriptional regulator with XRE-family HTH domain